jgi:hypothetical protein
MLLRYSVEIKSIIDQLKRAPGPTKTVVTPNVAVDLDGAWGSPCVFARWVPTSGAPLQKRTPLPFRSMPNSFRKASKVMDAKARVFRVAARLKLSPSRLSPIGRDKNFGYESL